MDFNFGNIYENLDIYDKRMALSFVLTIPVAYVLCLRVFDGFLNNDILTRMCYTLSLSLIFLILNHAAISFGQEMSQIFIPYRYLQLLLPQASTLAVSFAYGYTDKTHLSVFYVVVLIIIALAHILVGLAVANKDTNEGKPKENKKNKNPRRKRRK